MRSTLIGLSLIFFTLSVMVIIKAMQFPASTPLSDSAATDNPLGDVPLEQTASNRNDQKIITDELEDVAKKSHEGQNPESTTIADLKTVIAQLEDRLKTTEKTINNGEIKSIEIYPKTLAIFSGKIFRPGHDVISESAISRVEELIKTMSEFPESLILIEGHTDNTPTGKLNSDNMDLSVRRAKTIANALISRGISPERITVTGYGDTRPIDTNKTEEGRAKNRRVEVKLMIKEGKN